MDSPCPFYASTGSRDSRMCPVGAVGAGSFPKDAAARLFTIPRAAPRIDSAGGEDSQAGAAEEEDATWIGRYRYQVE